MTAPTDPLAPQHRPWWLRPDGSQFAPLPNDDACDRTLYQGVAALPDGWLGLAKVCQRPPPADPRTGPGSMYFMAYDFAADRLEPLVDEPWRFGVGATRGTPR